MKIIRLIIAHLTDFKNIVKAFFTLLKLIYEVYKEINGKK